MIYYSYPRYMVVSSKCELFSFVCCILHYYHSIFKLTLMNRKSGIILFTLISTSLCYNVHHNPSVSNLQSPSIILSDYRKNRGCVLIYEIRQLGRRWLRKYR